MALLDQLEHFSHKGLLGGTGRLATVLLLAAGLFQPGAASAVVAAMAVPAAVLPLAPAVCLIVVANTADTGAGSLRGAVGCATAGQTVTFSGLAGQTISLTGGAIPITQSITIDGSGAPGVMVDAGNASRVFNITASGPVTLTGLVLQHGHAASGNGGAVLAGGSTTLVLSQVQVLSSTAALGEGGGLYAGYRATLTGTAFISNTSGSAGGGAWVNQTTVVTNGRFERNTCTGAACAGGGLNAGTLTLTGTQFLSNTSTGNGGGAVAAGAAVLTNGSFRGNQCGSGCQGGGLYANTTLTLTGTDFISNTSTDSGGGAYTQFAAVLTNGRYQGNQCTGSGCQGGGLYAFDALTLTGTQFISNTSVGFGGGAFAFGAAVLTNGEFQDNHCTDGTCEGGGLAAATTLTLTGTQFISNTSISDGTRGGGGAYAQGAAVLTNGLFQGNRCTGSSGCRGGGLRTDGPLTLTGTDFIRNTSTDNGGGAYAARAAVLTNGLFQDNHCTSAGCAGGGLSANDTALVLGSSFSGNQAAGSGGAVGITATAQITLANVTLSDNLASVSGGGLFAGATSRASLWNVTVADNQAPSGGGVLAQAGATLVAANTLFSNNSGGNCSGPIDAGTHNLEFPGNACATADPVAGFSTSDPQLAPLALNAPGTTLTQALLNTSPARDAGDEAICAVPPVNNLDQRGVVRPIRGLAGPGPATCDMGAFEAGPPVWQLFLSLIRR